MENNFLGVRPDPRSVQEKSKDWQYEETARAVPFTWKEKTTSEIKFLSKRNQDGSSSCMAQSGAKLLGNENVVEEGVYNEMSATPLYQARVNKDGGMYQQDCLSIMCKPVVCMEADLPSQNLNETQINTPYTLTDKMKADAEKYRAGGYAFVPINIDKIASIIADGKAVQLVVYFAREEWWGNVVPPLLFPNLKIGDTAALHHGIAAVDFFLHNGEKALGIEDSAIIAGENGQRIITESFLIKRCYGAGYLLPLPNNHADVIKPKHTFFTPLNYGMRNNLDVKSFQDILKYEKFMLNSVPSTGNFLALTAQATIKWQVAHGIYDFQNEKNLWKVRVGPKSLIILRQIYG